LISQGQSNKQSVTISAAQQKALHMLRKMDTSIASKYFPNIHPGEFYRNVERNILFPDKLYQGHKTNFCGYAALTNVMLHNDPEIYTGLILTIFKEGKASFQKLTLEPSEPVRTAAGALDGKGELNINPADQLWFLTLADHYKDYLNIFNHKYQPGDENNNWASVNLSKFRRMAHELTGIKTDAIGTDLIRPWVNDYLEYLTLELSKGTVVLFVNSKYLYPSKYRIFNLHAPTHFIILYEINLIDGYYELMYWDYGMKTVQLFTEKRMHQLIYGVIRFNTRK
jgi:hypothetical protein